MGNKNLLCLEVWGDFACFTRPEMKVERVSYDVITPSSARAIFEAILWKPAIRWHIKRIEVLKPIRWISIRRNEVGSLMSDRSDGLFIEDKRQQKAGLLLRDVHYRIHAWMEYIPVEKRHWEHIMVPEYLWDDEENQELKKDIAAWQAKNDESPGKYLAMFERRAKKGQCFYQPYLGCREFSAMFKLIENPESAENQPIEDSMDFGYMLYDMDFSEPENIKPAFFRAEMRNGVIAVPPWESEEVHK